MIEAPHTSVPDFGAPKVIVLELPDAPPSDLHYLLRPTEMRDLSIGGQLIGKYMLVALIMYAKGYHYFADVLDPHERRWLRYDGLLAQGVGQPIAPTAGAQIDRGGTRWYPILAVYARQ